MPAQHVGALLEGHGDLLGANGHDAPGEGVVVLEHEADRDEYVVYVVKDEGILPGVVLAGLEEGDRVIPPVAEGVEMVRGVVAVVEAVTVTLREKR